MKTIIEQIEDRYDRYLTESEVQLVLEVGEIVSLIGRKGFRKVYPPDPNSLYSVVKRGLNTKPGFGNHFTRKAHKKLTELKQKYPKHAKIIDRYLRELEKGDNTLNPDIKNMMFKDGKFTNPSREEFQKAVRKYIYGE